MVLRDARRCTPRAVFWLVFVGMVLAIGGWSVANPDMAAPDEPAHAVKAAATVRGELVADESMYNEGRGDFAVPNLFAQSWGLTCFGFEPDVLPTCSPGVSGDLDAPSLATSHVARYNPTYYAIIGLPSLLPSSEWTFTLMRLVSAVLNAALVALVVRTIAELRRPTWVLLGATAAMTPMAIFTASSMTPQGPEIFAAILTTALLAALVFQPDESLTRRRLVRLVVACAAFVLTRGLSPAYLLIVIVAVIAIAPRYDQLLALLRRRATIVAVAVCGALSVGAFAYTMLSGSLSLGVVYPDATLTPLGVVSTMLENTDYYVRSMIGDFGWGDTPLPGWLLMLFAGAIIGITGIALALGTWRERIVLVALASLTLALPIAIQLNSFEESGIVWQGKYVLPIAITVPVLAGFVVARHADALDRLRPFVRLAIATLAVGQVIAFVTNVHRYVNGLDGPWLTFVEDAWTPRLGLVLPFVVEVAGWAIFVVVAALIIGRDDPLTHARDDEADDLPDALDDGPEPAASTDDDREPAEATGHDAGAHAPALPAPRQTQEHP